MKLLLISHLRSRLGRFPSYDKVSQAVIFALNNRQMKENRANFITDRTIVSRAPQAALSSCAKTIKPKNKYHEAVRADQQIANLHSPWISDVPDGSIAFHQLYGYVAWDSWWRFSTREFIADLKAAEENPAFIGHIIMVDSGGGECFGCHEAFEAVKSLKKPCIAVIDTICASAAYWIACAADKIYASSMFSTVGSIGTMGVFYNYDKYYENEGIDVHEYYSSYSDLKNKVTTDAKHGHPEDFIKEILDPYAAQFISDVRSVRNIPDDSEALRGKDYLASASPLGELIDGQNTLEEAVAEILVRAQADAINLNTFNL